MTTEKKERAVLRAVAPLSLLGLLLTSILTPSPAYAANPEITCSRRYTVQPGDYLSKIAARLGVPLRQILGCNQIPNPNLIHPNQVILVPGELPPAPRQTERQPTTGDSPSNPKDFDLSDVVTVTIPPHANIYGVRTNRLAHFDVMASFNGNGAGVTVYVYGPEKEDQVKAGLLAPWTGVLTPNKFAKADVSWSGANVGTRNQKWIIRTENSSDEPRTVTTTTSDRPTSCDNSYSFNESFGGGSTVILWVFCHNPNQSP